MAHSPLRLNFHPVVNEHSCPDCANRWTGLLSLRCAHYTEHSRDNSYERFLLRRLRFSSFPLLDEFVAVPFRFFLHCVLTQLRKPFQERRQICLVSSFP